MAKVISFCWETGRSISVRIDSDILSIKEDSLDSALCKVLKKGAPFYAEVLCLLGADVRQMYRQGNTLLHQCCDQAPQVLQFLSSRGCSLCEKNKRGETALHLTAQKGLLDNTQVLLDQGASPEERDLD